MSFKTFIPKIPIAAGVATGGITWLAVVFFLVSGMFGKTTKQAEFYVQNPTAIATLSFIGDTKAVVGQNIPVRIILNTNGQTISGVDARIKVTGATQVEISNTNLFGGNYPVNSVLGDIINISALANSEDQAVKGNNLTLAVLNIQASAAGQVKLEFVTDATSVSSQAQHLINIIEFPSPSIIPLLSPVPYNP